MRSTTAVDDSETAIATARAAGADSPKAAAMGHATTTTRMVEIAPTPSVGIMPPRAEPTSRWSPIVNISSTVANCHTPADCSGCGTILNANGPMRAPAIRYPGIVTARKGRKSRATSAAAARIAITSIASRSSAACWARMAVKPGTKAMLADRGALLQEHREEREVGRRDALEAPGLPEGRGPESLERLPRLGSQRGEGPEIGGAGDPSSLHLGGPPDLRALPRDVRLDRKSTRLNSSNVALSRMP